MGPTRSYPATENMTYLDKLPTVISCCFCCFLRAGTVMIAVVSFLAGLFLAPNINHTPGIWQLTSMKEVSEMGVEKTVHMILGTVSIFLCVISVLLLVGALCNIPKLLEIYQWGVMVYCVIACIQFLVLAFYCVFMRGDCATAAMTLLCLIAVYVLCTLYFVIVINSLRTDMIYLSYTTRPITQYIEYAKKTVTDKNFVNA